MGTKKFFSRPYTGCYTHAACSWSKLVTVYFGCLNPLYPQITGLVDRPAL